MKPVPPTPYAKITWYDVNWQARQVPIDGVFFNDFSDLVCIHPWNINGWFT